MTATPTHVPSTALATRASGTSMQVGAGQMAVAEMQAIEMQANMLATSSIVPRAFQNKPADIMAVASVGREVGLSVMASMQSIHIIEGKPTMSAQLMGALIRARGHSLAITRLDDDGVVMVGVRSDTGDRMEYEWTRAHAQAAGLMNKGVWKAHFRAMSLARCTSQIARNLFADVLAGISYTPEEGADIAGVDVKVDPEGEVVEIAGEVIGNRMIPDGPASSALSPEAAEAQAAEAQAADTGPDLVDAEHHAHIKAIVAALTAEERPFVAVYAKSIGAKWTLDEMTVEAADKIEAFVAENFPPVEDGELEEPDPADPTNTITTDGTAEAEAQVERTRTAANGAIIPPNPAASKPSTRRRPPAARAS